MYKENISKIIYIEFKSEVKFVQYFYILERSCDTLIYKKINTYYLIS